jgi:isoquinoline 1-oxidoreductase subunit beta
MKTNANAVADVSNAEQKKTRWKMTRRGFLIGAAGAGVLAVGAIVAIRPVVLPLLGDQFDDAADQATGTEPSSPLLWFTVDGKRGITLYAPKDEMGQGVHAMLAQLAAEELQMDPMQLHIVIANSSQAFAGVFGTYGSDSARGLYLPLRQAAANLREMLRVEAGQQLGVALDQVAVNDGHCFAPQKPEKKLSYAEIAAAKAGAWQEPAKPAVIKRREQFKLIGTNTARVDVPDKITGQLPFGISARLPNMLYGAVARPPRLGAILRAGEPGNAASMPGVKQVVIDIANNFAGVVADTRTRARNALAQLKLDYQGGSTMSQAELEQRVTAKASDGTLLRKRGDLAATLGDTPLVAAYRTPAAAHAHLEPLTALVDFRADAIEAWVSTQTVATEARLLEAAFGKDRRVLVHGMHVGGSFGRKGWQSAIVEAARLSRAVAAPVSVLWSREEEMRHSFYRQPSHTVMRGSISDNGRILALEQSIATVHASGRTNGPNLLERVLASYDIDGSSTIGMFTPYEVPHYRAYMRAVTLPLPTGIWRGVALLQNIFALESFADELAWQAKIDPLEFRLKNLPNTVQGQRMRTALEALKIKSDWMIPPPSGRARGVACGFGSGATVAMVAEVRIADGQIAVTRFTVVVEAGLIVNPAGAELQAKGSVLMGMSSTLLEKITIKDGVVEQSNFDSYPLLRLAQTPPQIDVHFLPSDLDPQGMGEPVIGPVAPAIANAVHRLTGKRLRELPLRLDEAASASTGTRLI